MPLFTYQEKQGIITFIFTLVTGYAVKRYKQAYRFDDFSPLRKAEKMPLKRQQN